jgi:hypothetical protein
MKKNSENLQRCLLRAPALWLWLACGIAVFSGVARATTLRIVSYNIDCADTASDSNITNAPHTLPTVVQAIGLHHLGTNAQPMDVMGCEELLSTTLSNFVVQLNAIYGAGTYTNDRTADQTTGGGTDGLIYNTHTVQVISARSLMTGTNVLLQSNGIYTNAHAFGIRSNGVTRAPMVYRIRPVGYGPSADFYMYVSHARAGTDNSVGDARYAEAQQVRSDAKYNLPAGAHILYSGDWNLFHGSSENAYKCLAGQITADGIDWSDNSAIWANTNQTQGYDPMSQTSPPTTRTWVNAPGDNASYLYTETTSSITERLDVQLPNALMFAAYNANGGTQLAPDAADPFDVSNFPASQYPYAFEVFGNNGGTGRSNSVTSSSNHSVDDLNGGTPNAATAKSDILQTGSGSTSAGSDHYPIFGDYVVAPVPPSSIVLTSEGLGTNGNFDVEVSSATNTGFGIQASTDLVNWAGIGSGVTDTNGLLLFEDTNTPANPSRFYRAVWPSP